MITLNHSTADLLKSALHCLNTGSYSQAIPYIQFAIESLENEKLVAANSIVEPAPADSLETTDLTLGECCQRWGVASRNAIKARAAALGVALRRESSTRTVWPAEHLPLGDELAEHLKKPGGTLANFAGGTLANFGRSLMTPFERLLTTPSEQLPMTTTDQQAQSEPSTRSSATLIQGDITASITSRKVHQLICDYIRQVPKGHEFRFIDVKMHLKYVLGFAFTQKISNIASDHLDRLTKQKYLQRLYYKSTTYTVVTHPVFVESLV